MMEGHLDCLLVKESESFSFVRVVDVVSLRDNEDSGLRRNYHAGSRGRSHLEGQYHFLTNFISLSLPR
jgi:hypothetical protein